MSELNDISERFRRWYKEPIETLIANEHAGFAVLTLTLPVLERFTRNRAKIGPEENLPKSSEFYKELVRLFPGFKYPDYAFEFWRLYRHGLLHQATLNGKCTFIKDDGPLVQYWNGAFTVSANKLAKRVLSIVGNDLSTFEGSGPPLPTVTLSSARSGVF